MIARWWFAWFYENKMVNLPHVDEILGEGNGVRVAGNGDGAVGGSALALLTITDADHGAGYLAYLRDLGTSLANDATDQLIGHCHLVRLVISCRLLPICVVGAQLTTR